MIVRSEAPGDVAAIRTVEEAAFLQSVEAQLVDDLRDAGNSVFSLIAVEDETITGHAMFSRLQAPFPALALGPVAVLPDRPCVKSASLPQPPAWDRRRHADDFADSYEKHPACSRLCKARIVADRSATPGAAIPV